MAPNRKQVVDLELPIGVEGLQSTLQAKYMPLTDPREQQQHEEQQQQQQCRQFEEVSASYWDWTSDTKAEEEAETITDLFSVSHITDNLIKDGEKRDATPSNQIAAHDDYWADHAQAEDVHEVEELSKPQHKSDSYWYCPANQRVYKEERALRLTSASNIQSHLTSAKQCIPGNRNEEHDRYWLWKSESRHSDTVSRTLTTKHPYQDYWTWETLTHEDEKQQLIQSILQYEAARRLLSAEHIEENLQLQAFQYEHHDNNHVAPAISTGNVYWDW